MFFYIKILRWILILEVLTAINNFRISILHSTNILVYCFKQKNSNNTFIIKGINTPKSPNLQRNFNLLSQSLGRSAFTSSNIDISYLSNLNRDIKILNKSIAEKNVNDCYRDLQRVFELFSNVISALYSEPVELDLNTKLDEVRDNFGFDCKLTLNSCNVNPILFIKFYKDYDDKPDLPFEYLTKQNLNGTLTYRIFRRDFVCKFPAIPTKQLGIAFKEFSRTFGNFLIKFYLSELPFDDLVTDAILLGLRGTVELFEGLSLLELTANTGKGYSGLFSGLKELINANYDELRSDSTKTVDASSRDNLFNSLAMIDYFSNFDSVRSRFYSKLIGHYFKLKDPESILIILKHMIKYNDRKIISVYLTQYLISLAHGFQKDLSSITGDNKQAITGKKNLYLELKNKIISILKLYTQNHLHTFNVTHELAQIIEKNYSNIAPGLFKSTFVSSDKENSGTCESCGYKIQFQDISEDDRFDLFSKLIETIYSTSPNELFGLYEFYKFLLRAKDSRNPYTCVIDGQNVGYSRNILRVLSWFKIYYSYSFMRSLGENALIVIPEASVKYIATYLQRKDPAQLKLLNQVMENKDIYMTKRDSYDDNFFLLAGISTFSNKEIELFNHYMSRIVGSADSVKDGLEATDSTSSSGFESESVKRVDLIDLNRASSFSSQKSELDSNSQFVPNKNVIILTNDKLNNLNIDNVNRDALEKWKDNSLINFKILNISNREMIILGQRLRYNFSIVSDGNSVHIPTGYDRVFTNISESLKCTFECKNIANSAQFVLNLCEERETPIRKWIQSSYEHLYNINQNSTGVNGDKSGISMNYGRNGYTNTGVVNLGDNTGYELKGTNAVNKNYNKIVDTIHHKSPEIAKLMFSPGEKSRWLCIDLSAIDRAISAL